ncbi:TrbM/KikA/MpfK family conjugal transfer protein [Methylomonas lenta]|nr:TrbM/KikA/MpfK family conjugal transfer protein [Methylomonas lenta]
MNALKLCIAAISIFPMLVHAQSNTQRTPSVPTPQWLTGDRKLACEAILCLASNRQPDECQESLNRYFGIDFDDMSDTATARANFLNQCPRQ